MATEPVAEAIAQRGASHGHDGRPPWVQHLQPGQDAADEHHRAAGDGDADHHRRLQQRGGKDSDECKAGVLRERIDQGLHGALRTA